MARQRFIHPEFWTDPTIGKMLPIERLFFIGCFSNADDYGRLLGNPAYLRSAIFPYDDLTITQVTDIRDHVVQTCKNLVLYTIDGQDYLAFVKWTAYQKPRYPKPSKLPEPPTGETLQKDCGSLAETIPHRAGQGRVGMGRDGQGRDGCREGEAPLEADWTPCLRKEDRRKPIMEGITNALAPYARLLSSKEHSKILELLETHCQFMYKRDWCHYPPECLQFFAVVCDKFKIAVEREQENGKPIRSVPALLETIYAEELGKWGDQFSRTAKSLA